MTLRVKYPELEPLRTGYMQVDAEHTIYWEECGNPKGKPVVFVHGGPGSSIDPGHRRYFDPQAYRIVLFDQRGAGKSRPHASLNNNTTWHLVSDMERLREKMGIEKWQVFGGSWGSTLALSYAIKHPDRVSELVLRGIFLLRPHEIEWFYQQGASRLFPDEWEKYVAPIPQNERSNMVAAYHKRLTSEDENVRLEACKAWASWEGSTLKLLPDPETFKNFTVDHQAVSLARIECHYFMNNGFFDSNNWVLENAHKIVHIPAVIVHGRYDVICPVENAWELHKALPKSKLQIVADAGHAASEPGIVDALIRATDSFR